VAPQVADAHGLGKEIGLPVPIWLFSWAASVVLVVSFVALAALWTTPRLEGAGRHRVAPLGDWADALVGTVGIGVFGIVAYAGLAGTDVPTANLAPTLIFVCFWVGLVVASLLLGDVFRLLSPWRAIARLMAWLFRTVSGEPRHARFAYPRWLGRWPAAAGLAGFAWLELVYPGRDRPSTLAWLAVGYACVQLAGMALFGIERWSRRGDAFGVYFGLFAALAPWERRDGWLYLRPPLSGASKVTAIAGTIAVLSVMIGSTTFDGGSEGQLWGGIAPHLQSVGQDLGLSATGGLELANTVGLAVAIALVAGFYRLGIRGMRRFGLGAGDWSASVTDVEQGFAERFVFSLIPIAAAYVLAHYFSSLVFQGQAIVPLASDPLGNGANWLGTANDLVDYHAISTAGIWYVQVAVLVSGHAAGLMLAHDRAVGIFQRPRDAARSQQWMLVIMVGFTCLALFLISTANSG
jgi:hypothetical protein